MDENPFFEFNMLTVDSRVVAEIKKFAKITFNVEAILSNASELKYMKLIRAILESELSNPSEELVKLMTSRVYSGRFTAVDLQSRLKTNSHNWFKMPCETLFARKLTLVYSLRSRVGSAAWRLPIQKALL